MSFAPNTVPRGSRREGIIDTERAVAECDSVADVVPRLVPRLAAGIELIGEYQGSGFHQPRYLVRRADGQVIQLPRLLYLLAVALDGQHDLTQVADALSAQFGRAVQAQQVWYLIDNKLRPAGIVAADPRATYAEEPATRKVKSDPLLAFKFRVGVLPAR